MKKQKHVAVYSGVTGILLVLLFLSSAPSLRASDPVCTGPKMEKSDNTLYCKSENSAPCRDLYGCNGKANDESRLDKLWDLIKELL